MSTIYFDCSVSSLLLGIPLSEPGFDGKKVQKSGRMAPGLLGN